MTGRGEPLHLVGRRLVLIVVLEFDLQQAAVVALADPIDDPRERHVPPGTHPLACPLDSSREAG